MSYVARRRALGQHFLKNAEIAEFIASRVPIGSTVLEIGPGLGILTRELAKRASKVYAIELDRELAKRLKGIPNVEVIEGDALKVDWPKADFFASNIPYYITSPLLLRLAEAHLPAVVMLQREVANRLAAEPGEENYGRLTVAIKCKYHVEILRVIPPKFFDPPPKVYSAIVELKPLKPCVDDFKKFEEFTAFLFSRRRKTLRKLIKTSASFADKRVYQLSIEELVELYNAVA